MTDVASVPTVTEKTKAEDAKLFVDDKKSRSDLECFVHEEYFVPKTEEHLIRPPLAPEEKRTEEKKEGKKKRPIVKIDIRDKLCSSLIDVRPGSDPPVCQYNGCKMQHDIKAWLETKPPDAGPECYIFNTQGYCPRGATCRLVLSQNSNLVI